MRSRPFASVILRHTIASVVSVLFLVSAAACADEASDQREILVHYAAEHTGDSQRGERQFRENPNLQCSNCHNVSGLEKSGPNLEGIADKFTRQELVRQLLYPSESIKPGFEQVIIQTNDGLTHTGRLERSNKVLSRLIDAEGRQTEFKADEIERMEVSTASMMPENIASVIDRQEFIDLVAYLETLTFGVHDGLVAGGKPIAIPRAERPVTFRAIHRPEQAFENPVWCVGLPGSNHDLLVIEHSSSRIWRLIRDEEPPRKELFLDLADQTHISGNQGVMCLAFHPQYESNRRYFVEHEVQEEGQVKTTVVERRASADGRRDSGQPSRRLLEVFQPAYNHNGGCLAFGPDGMLYIAFGDGGPQRDPPGYSQNPRIFHGSMLRIDVDHTEPNRPYAIPPDNPFLAAHRNDPAVRPETWAIGLREPWRFSFDAKTGELYVGDVGQDQYEEVCIVRPGENHGWNVREAYAPFSDEYRREGETYTDPIFAYEHGLGFSVTGGYVYRGNANPSFDGVYIFGDYSTRRVWGLKQQDHVVSQVVEIGTSPGSIASFGVDARGEIYLVTYMGSIYHVDLADAEFPSLDVAADAPAQDTVANPTIFVCGDSTAKNSGRGKNGSPVAGWGTPIAEFFDPEKAVVRNVGHAGRSSRTYFEGDWPNVLPQIKQGDFVLLVFGINDGSTPPGLGDETVQQRGRPVHTYGWYMSKMATDAERNGADVYLLTVTTRNIWRNPKARFRDATPIDPLPEDYDPSQDRIERGTGGGRFTQWTKDVGAKLHLPVFDLTNFCADKYEAMGREAVDRLYSDHNHTYVPGAEVVAAAIVSGLKAFPDSPFLPLLSAKGKAVETADARYVSDNIVPSDAAHAVD